jgi:hypothetical protein
MERPSEQLKSFANRLALVASSEDGKQALRLLQLSELLGQPANRIPQQASTDKASKADVKNTRITTPTNSEQVGIWEREKNTGCFTRRSDMFQDWGLWANVAEIKPKGVKRRVVLIGESVARGFLYGTQFTPTMALETILQSYLGTNGVEVIDLARTNLGMEVRELAISALLLEPDIVVIFSGNNWGHVYSNADFTYTNSILLEHGIAGLKHYSEEKLAEAIKSIVGDIASAYRSKKIPLIWIIPEFNLGDWRDTITNAPHLGDGSNEEWMAYWKCASAALKQGDIEVASDLAKKMVELDQQVCVTGLYILAECSQRQGNLDMTRYYLECARDVTIWDPEPSSKSPRPYSVTQNMLRREAAKHSNEIVDLPKIFREYLNGKLPDRRLFLDYCHLTIEGIQISMAAAASCVLQILRGVSISWSVLVRGSATPSSKVKAEAAFLAAIHNAHWHQRYELVHYYCLQALQLAPDIAQVMTHFIDIQCRRLPMLMCQAVEELAGSEWPSIHHYLFRFNRQMLDKLLLDAMVNSLEKVGVNAAERLDQLRLEEHSVTLWKANLLEYYYCSAAIQPQEAMWVTPGITKARPSNYYKAYSSESRFFFVGDASCPVRLSLTVRLPDLAFSRSIIFITVNGEGQEEIAISHEWTTWDITIERAAVRDGLNEVIIHWPHPVFPGRRGIEAAANDILHGVLPEFYCIFGEIHSFTAAGAKELEIITSAGQENLAEVPSDFMSKCLC